MFENFRTPFKPRPSSPSGGGTAWLSPPLARAPCCIMSMPEIAALRPSKLGRSGHALRFRGFEASFVFEVGWQARLRKWCGRSLPSGYTSHHPNTSPVHSLALALILAASGGRAQAVQRKAVGCKAVGCKAMGGKPWGCNTDEVVVGRWCGEVVERWEHVHVHTHTPHTHRRMS